MIRKKVTDFALWLIRRVNPNKSRILARKLYALYAEYETREVE